MHIKKNSKVFIKIAKYRHGDTFLCRYCGRSYLPALRVPVWGSTWNYGTKTTLYPFHSSFTTEFTLTYILRIIPNICWLLSLHFLNLQTAKMLRIFTAFSKFDKWLNFLETSLQLFKYLWNWILMNYHYNLNIIKKN